MGRSVRRADSPDVLRILSDSSPSSAESSFRELDDVFLQTQTRIWLGEVLHTRLDEETAIADLLADGQLLFQVSKVVWKLLLTKCMELRYSKTYIYEPNASGKSSGRYMPYSNVDSFLKICQILGLTGIDLFSPSDVVEKRDIRRVCMCIRSLSKKARSKRLNVPDFDVVTYTIAMPTDMVGCIRRNLEKSQSNSSSSTCCSPCTDSKVKYMQKTWSAHFARQYDSYSEESDEAESNFRVHGFHSPDSNTSFDTASLLVSNLEKSSGGILDLVEDCILVQSIFPSDIQDQGTDVNKNPYGPPCFSVSTCSPDTNHIANDNHQFFSALPDIPLLPSPVESQIDLNARASYINRGGVRHAVCTPENGAMGFFHVDLELGSPDPFVGNSIDGNTSVGSYVGQQLDISDLTGYRTDNGDSVLFDEDGMDRIFNAYAGTSNDGSSSKYRTSGYDLGRRFSDEIKDIEASSTASLNSVSDQVVTVDHKDQFGLEHGFTRWKNQFSEPQNLRTDHMDKQSVSGHESQDMVDCHIPVSSVTPDMDNVVECHIRVNSVTPDMDCMVECHIPVNIITPDTDKPQGDMKFDDAGSTKPFLPTEDQQPFSPMGFQNHVVRHAHGIDMSSRDLVVAKADSKLLSNCNDNLNIKGVLRNEYWNQIDGVMLGQFDSSCSIQATWNEKHKCSMPMVSNRSNGLGASSELVSPHGLYPNFLSHTPTEVSGDVPWFNDDNSIVADNVNKVSIATIASINGLYINTRNHLNNYPSTACFNNDEEVTCGALDAAPTAKESVKCNSPTPVGGGGGGDLQQHNSIDISYCDGVETKHKARYLEARIEKEMKVLGGQDCSKNVFTQENLNCSSNESFEEGVDSKNTLEEKIVLNCLSSVLTGTGNKEVEHVRSLSSEPSCVPQVNPSGISFGGSSKTSALNMKRESNSHVIWFHRSSSLATIPKQNLITRRENINVPMDKCIQPVSGVVQSTESGSQITNFMDRSEMYSFKIGRMGSPVDFREPCLSGLEIQDIGDQESQTDSMSVVDDLVVHHNSDVLVKQHIFTPENQHWSTVGYSENIGKNHSSQHLVDNNLQVVHGTCVNHHEEVGYCTKNMDKDKEKHEKESMRELETSEGRDSMRCVDPPECKPHKKSLLKSVAGGVTLFGALFLVLHFRRKNGTEKIGETSVSSMQIQKASHGEVSTQNARNRDRIDGVYPGEKLRFQ